MSERAWDEEAERAALGSMMLSRDAIADVMTAVHAQDFYRPGHETIFTRITQMYLRGEPVDAVTLSSSLRASGDLLRCGGGPYLHLLAGTPVSAASAGFYADRVADVARLRKFQEVSSRIGNMGAGVVLDDLDAVVDKARTELDAIRPPQRTGATSVSDALAAAWEEIENPVEQVAMHSGLADLDEFYRGVGAGRLDVVGARPSMGKSIAGLGYIRENTIRPDGPRIPTALFTMEMGASEVTKRLISACAEVDLDRLTEPLHHPLGERDRWCISQVYNEIESAPLTIHEDPVSLADVQGICKDLFRGGEGFVVIDFLQLMLWPGWARNEVEAVGHNVYGLKQLARSQRLRILTLAQLNRNPTQRAGGVPQMSDIGGSGKVEQAADVVILIDRPETRDREDRPGEADLIVAKQRDGRTGTATVAFRGHRAKFSGMARDVA